MNSKLALLICIIFIFYLFWLDRKKIDGVSSAIWIPLIWMLVTGSRFVSHWINIRSSTRSLDVYIEGSPIDRLFFFILIATSIIVLLQRRLNWFEILKNNFWISLYFFFGLFSIFWSDYPSVSIKRWIKTIGTAFVILVIMTENRPYKAIGVIFRRVAFVLMPLSALFIKYFPDIGRTYHMGKPMFSGIAEHKNTLGLDCLIFGIYFCWSLLYNRCEKNELSRQLYFSIYFIIVPMTAWILLMADSATSLACLIIAICLLLIGRLSMMVRKPGRIILFTIVSILLFGIIELSFDVKDTLITMLGRRPDLTTRIPMWEDLLTMVENPIIGYGWEGFWLGKRQQLVYEKWSIASNAHNGYLESYLNLGFIGLLFIMIWILLGLIKVWNQLVIDYPGAMLKFCFIVVVALYNWTEAAFNGVGYIWMVFIIATLEVHGKQPLKPIPP